MASHSQLPLTHRGLSGNTAKRLALGKGKKATYRAEKLAAKGEVVQEATTNKTAAGPQDCEDPWSLSSKVRTHPALLEARASVLQHCVCLYVEMRV